jgi:hypothetical protein
MQPGNQGLIATHRKYRLVTGTDHRKYRLVTGTDHRKYRLVTGTDHRKYRLVTGTGRRKLRLVTGDNAQRFAHWVDFAIAPVRNGIMAGFVVFRPKQTAAAPAQKSRAVQFRAVSLALHTLTRSASEENTRNTSLARRVGLQFNR